LVKEWQVRPLEDTYCIVWLDGMHYKVKQEGRVQSRCVYNIFNGVSIFPQKINSKQKVNKAVIEVADFLERNAY
jgi:hypothetical protein